MLNGGRGPEAVAAQLLRLAHPPQQIPPLHQQLLVLLHHRPDPVLLLRRVTQVTQQCLVGVGGNVYSHSNHDSVF